MTARPSVMSRCVEMPDIQALLACFASLDGRFRLPSEDLDETSDLHGLPQDGNVEAMHVHADDPIARGGHDNHGNVAPAWIATHPSDQFDAVHDRHQKVNEQQGRHLATQNVERCASMLGNDAIVALVLEQFGHRLADIAIVLHEKHRSGASSSRVRYLVCHATSFHTSDRRGPSSDVYGAAAELH